MQKQSTFPLGYIKIWLKDKLFLISVAVAFTGIALRLKQYLTNRSLWSDEASLALNIVERSFKELAQPLDYHQGAPLGFLWIQKGIVILFGSSEYALRLVPLICGISSLFIFWFIAAKYLNKRATCLAFTLFAISDLPIYFSSEAKQYSCDVMVGLLTLVMLFSLTKRNQNLGYLSVIGYGLLGAIFIWMSHPAIFFLGSVGISVIYGYYVRSEYNKIKYLVLMGSVWVVSFLPWIFVASYYLLPVTLGIGFSTSVIVVFHFSEHPKRSGILPLTFLGLSGFLFLVTIMNIYTFARQQLLIDQVNWEMLAWVENNLPENSNLIVVLPAGNEYTLEIGMHLSQGFHRDDLVIRSIEDFPAGDPTITALDTYLLLPILNHQVLLSPRMGVDEETSSVLKERYLDLPDMKVRDIHSLMGSFRIRSFNPASFFCPGFDLAKRNRIFEQILPMESIDRYCTSTPLLEMNPFEYGWSVLQL